MSKKIVISNQRKNRKCKPLPKFWLGKLDNREKLDCKLIHWDLIDRITSGSADKADLWDWMETGFTYSQLLRLLSAENLEFSEEAISAIDEQLKIYLPIATRINKFGTFNFTDQELLIARTAAAVFDSLIELDRNGCAERAALWSQQQMEKMMRTSA